MNTSDRQYLKTLADKSFAGVSVEKGLDLHIKKADTSGNLVAAYSNINVFEFEKDTFKKLLFTDLKVAKFNGLLEKYVMQLKSELHSNACCFSEAFYVHEAVTWITGRLDSLGHNADAYQIGKSVFIVCMDRLPIRPVRI